MPAAGEQAEAGVRLAADLAFGQDPPPDRDHRVGRERDERGEVRDLGCARGRSFRLLRRQPLSQRARLLVASGRLIDLGRQNGFRVDADLGEQREAAGRPRGQDQPRAG